MARSLTLASLGAGLGLGCAAADKGYTPEPTMVPENEQRVHKPSYIIQATLEEGEMEAKTKPDVVVAKGEPPTDPARQPWAEPTMDSAPTSIEIDASLAQACKIPEAKAFFDSDQSELQPEAQAALDALAECFKSGPMKGHRLSITGHADPQGSEAYNRELGWARAAAVADHIAAAGLAKHEMEQQSAGEDAAHQDDPSMWPYDRKVVLDISVEDDAEAPAAE
jgi:peptidoglycan-associated lipoprotein